MRVICPECSAEYDVPVPLLGEQGRRVRCSNCSHVWIAEIREEDGAFGGFRAFDENMDMDPIPASLHPEDGEDAYSHGGPGFFASLDKGYLAKMAGGIAIVFLLFGVFLGIGAAAGLNEGAMRPLFTPFGLAGTPEESPLSIKDVVAQTGQDAAGQPVFNVSGKIHNASEHKLSVPQLEVRVLSEAGLEGDSVHVDTDNHPLEGGKDMDFKAVLPGGAGEKAQVRVQFIP